MIELYPSCTRELIVSQLIERIPHKNMHVETQYIYMRFIFDVARACPALEERLLEAVVDRLCQLDVDIKATKAKRRCQTFSSLSKI